MARVFVSGASGQQARAARVMSVTAGTVLMTVGAILLFAVTGASPHWLNLQIVGIILILAGVLGLSIPRLARSSGSLYRRWVVPMVGPQRHALVARGEFTRAPGVNGDAPTLADDLLSFERDPPI